jgi:hypothetical protein
MSKMLKTWNPFKFDKAADFFDSKKMMNIDKFNIIIGNPPYKGSGSRGLGSIDLETKKEFKRNFPNSAEYKINLYPMFIELAITKLSDRGICSYIVPDSYLVGRYFSKIRSYILKKMNIKKLILLDSKVFESATVGFSSIFILNNQKTKLNKVELLKFEKNNLKINVSNFFLKQNFFEENKYNRFYMLFNEFDFRLFNQLNNQKYRIKDFATGRTGIRSKIGQKNIISKKTENQFYKSGLISGSQILPFKIKYDEHYLNVEPKNLNAGGFDKDIIEKDKILIRQTGDKLIASIDKNKYYHLNNIHSLSINANTEGVNLELLCSILNSKLINYFYEIISLEKNRPFAQVDIETLELLPLPEISKEKLDYISSLINNLNQNKEIIEINKIYNKIDDFVFDIYGISEHDALIIKNKV